MHRRDLFIVPFVIGGFLLVCSCAGPSAERTVTVMTYNIHHGEAPDGDSNLETVARLIRAHGVDVVGLQEVDRHWSSRSQFTDQVEELARRVDMNYFFGSIYDREPARSGQPRRQYGLAILTNRSIAAQTNYEITRLSTVHGTAQPKPMGGFPGVAIDLEGSRIHVFNTHLDYRPDPAVRRQQVVDMMEHMDAIEEAVVLVGDFNAPPGASELTPLSDRFVDAWKHGGEGSGYTYPADQPEKRIDHIWVDPNIRVDSVIVPETTASDHRPVVAHLSVPIDRG